MLNVSIGTQIGVIVATGGGHGINITDTAIISPVVYGGLPGGGNSGGGSETGAAGLGVGSGGGGFSALLIDSTFRVVAAGGGGLGINNQHYQFGPGTPGVIVMANAGGGGCYSGGNATASVPGC